VTVGCSLSYRRQTILRLVLTSFFHPEAWLYKMPRKQNSPAIPAGSVRIQGIVHEDTWMKLRVYAMQNHITIGHAIDHVTGHVNLDGPLKKRAGRPKKQRTAPELTELAS